MAGMSNEEITAEFEALFGSSSSEETETAEPEEVTDEANEPEEISTEESETAGDEQTGDEAQDESDTHHDEPADSKSVSKQQKQNYAFAQQRQQIKEHNDFIRTIGKLIGFDENASPEDIKAKVKDVLIEKEAKDQNISVELMRRLDKAEEVIQENQRIKLENKVTGEFADLIEEYSLDKEDIDAFTQHLIEEGKNPLLDERVDIKAEYLKLHYQDLIDAAVKAALAKEEARQKKVEEKAASGVSKGAADKGDSKVNSVKELDDLFAGIDL